MRRYSGYCRRVNRLRRPHRRHSDGKEIQNAGVQGMILEDQLWPKRCGYMVGKKVIPMEEYKQKLLAALEAPGVRRNLS